MYCTPFFQSVVTYKNFCFQLGESFLNPDVTLKFSIYMNKYVFTYSAHHENYVSNFQTFLDSTVDKKVYFFASKKDL